jgi:hypothetical protein
VGRVEKLTVEKSTLETTTKLLSNRYELQMLENSRLLDENDHLKEDLQKSQLETVELKNNVEDKLKAIATIQ